MSELKPCEREAMAKAFNGILGPIIGRPERMELAQQARHKMVNALIDAVQLSLMDDTPALLRGARIGLEMAAKVCETAHKLPAPPEARGNSIPYLAGMVVCFDAIKAIPDTDIMKEISRE